jgi:hypothetical protein
MLTTAFAQAAPARCAAHTAVVERLADIYGERRQAMGVASGNTVIEVYASDESGSWSITMTQPGGPTCLVAAGQGFRLAEPPLPVEDPDA